EDSTEKHPVTPAPVVPARELLGEMLLELNQPAQALVEFEASATREPNLFNGLFGAARAAELSGDRSKAKARYAKLVAMCDRAGAARGAGRGRRAGGGAGRGRAGGAAAGRRRGGPRARAPPPAAAPAAPLRLWALTAHARLVYNGWPPFPDRGATMLSKNATE